VHFLFYGYGYYRTQTPLSVVLLKAIMILFYLSRTGLREIVG